MIKTHTAQSLGKYLNTNVLVKALEQEYVGKLIMVKSIPENGIIKIKSPYGGMRSFDLDGNIAILPKLKTYEKLLEPMIHEGKQIIPIKYIYLQLYYTVSKECWESIRISDSGIWSIDGCLVAPDFQMLITMVSSTPQIIERLIELGFGAIKDESSPTGYRDLFGYVCEVER